PTEGEQETKEELAITETTEEATTEIAEETAQVVTEETETTSQGQEEQVVAEEVVTHTTTNVDSIQRAAQNVVEQVEEPESSEMVADELSTMETNSQPDITEIETSYQVDPPTLVNQIANPLSTHKKASNNHVDKSTDISKNESVGVLKPAPNRNTSTDVSESEDKSRFSNFVFSKFENQAPSIVSSDIYNYPDKGERYIGEYYAGGIIFYLDKTGKHGLVVSLYNLHDNGNEKVPWCEKEPYNVGNMAHSQYDGKANTNYMIHSGIKSSASLCTNLGYGWYLPSVWELQQLEEQIHIVNDVLEKDGNEATQPLLFTESEDKRVIYWSSSKYNQVVAWSVLFSEDVFCALTRHAAEKHYVRAVKRF
ncbi:MAG: hypothetical protein MI922_24295, partial [Bacteroidales bacterium]|nr:hypothetical protein [Bacteroidales bacterium]